MMTYFKNLKVRSKIYVGFGIVLAALVLTIGIIFGGLQSVNKSFDNVDELVKDAEIVARLQSDIARVDAKTLIWLRTQNEETLQQVKTENKEVQASLEETKAAIQNPERAEELRKVDAAYDNFYNGVLQVEEYMTQRNDLVLNTMDKIGPQARRMITDVAEGAYNDGDYETATYAGFANQYLLLARFYANKFLLDNKEEDKKSFEKHWASLQVEFKKLDRSTQNPKRREILAEVRSMMPEYEEAFNQAHEIILARNEVISSNIIDEALAISASGNKIQESVVVDKNKYIDEFKDTKNALMTQTSIVGLIGFLASLGIAYFMARQITTPVNKIRESVSALSEGRLTEEIPGGDTKDEIGEMARSLSEFREEAVQAIQAKSGVEGASTGIMMTDKDLKIIFMNDSQVNMLKDAQEDIRKDIPGFDVNSLVGQSVDQFYKDPVNQRQILANLNTTNESRVEIGGRTFDLYANPAFSKSGERLGTSIEWVDRTVELAIGDEIKEIIDMASSGNLDKRIKLDGKDGFFHQVSEGINDLADVIKKVTDDLARNLKSLSQGDLNARITKDYEGVFKDLKDDFNTTSEKLAQIAGAIKGIAVEVKGSADEMADSSEGLSSRVEEQASTLEETASSMEELTSTVKTNAESAQEASDAANKTRGIAERGSQVANDAGTAMEKINESSKQITEIINVIDEIAFQTNLLALNAAVEAARAGDAGRGFAVVAQEVRTLAQRSAQSSKDIKALIDDSSRQVGDGVELVQTAVSSLKDIYDSIDSVSNTISQIASASAEQATSLDEVNQAVMEMDSVTQQNASMAQQSRNIAQVMQDKSEDLTETVAFFKLDGAEDLVSTSASRHKTAPVPEAANRAPANNGGAHHNGGAEYAKATGTGGNGSAQAAIQAENELQSSDNDADWKEF